MNERNSTPWWFWTISAVLLLWNLMGVEAYIAQVTAGHEDLIASYGQEQADVIASQPSWYVGAFALAVFAGALGCLFLLLRRTWAFWPLLISLLCVMAQNVYFYMNGLYEYVHGGAWVMTIAIPIIAIFLVWFSKRMSAKGILR